MVSWIPIDYKENRQAWNEFRTRGVGASSVSCILGYDKYKSNLEYFYECIGEPSYSLDNLRTISGRETEPLTATYWKCWEGSERSIVENFNAGRIVRECEPVNAFCVNDKYPYLYASLDRRILKYGSFKTDGALELKNTIERVVVQYEGRVVPTHLIQNLIQCTLSEYEFGEVAVYLVDSGKFEVLPVHDLSAYKELIESMIAEVNRFWEKVLVARGYYTRKIDYEMKQNFRKVAEMESEIARLEPPVQNTEVYMQFLTKKFKDRIATVSTIKGTAEQYQAAKRHKDISMQIKEMQDNLRYEEIALKTAIGGASKMEFDKGMGYISWAQNATSRPFLNKVI